MSFAVEVVKGKKYRLFAELGFLPNGKRERKTKMVEAKGIKEARKLAQEFEDDLLARMVFDENMLFMEFTEKWIDNYASVELEQSTFENYKSALKVITEYFPKQRVSEIKALSIIEFFNSERKLKRGSLEAKYKVLKSLFKYAVQWSIIKDEDNPMLDIEKPKNAQKQTNKDFYRNDEIKIMLNLIEELTEEQQLIVQLALVGALRRGEIIAITHDVLDFENSSILIKRSLQQSKKDGVKLKGTKSEDTRIIILPKSLMDRLHKLYIKKLNLRMSMGKLWEGHKEDGKELIFLFSNEYGKPYRPDSITQFWNRFTIRHKDVLRRIRFHDLRHSSATFLLSEGVNMKVIQKRLGHKNIKTTLNLYSHVSEKDDEKVSELFSDFL